MRLYQLNLYIDRIKPLSNMYNELMNYEALVHCILGEHAYETLSTCTSKRYTKLSHFVGNYMYKAFSKWYPENYNGHKRSNVIFLNIISMNHFNKGIKLSLNFLTKDF